MLNLKDEIKIIVVGNSSVGKSCLIYYYINDAVLPDAPSTVGIDFFIKNVVIDNYPMTFKIWDTAGQEKFRNIVKSFFRGVDGAFLVFDITSIESFNSITGWIDLINEETNDDVDLLLVGNKHDLSDKREVPIDEAQELAKKYNIKYFETSAKNGYNIEEAFMYLGQQILKNLQTKSIDTQKNIKISNETNKNQKECC